jgi:PhnB protein
MAFELPHAPIVPALSYADAPAAIEFLCDAFGFEEIYRLPMPDGRIGHAELRFGASRLNLASAFPEMGLRPPGDEGIHSQLAVYVDDVDAHHARAVAAGATVVGEPEDQPYGARMYRAVDPEGHRWMFLQLTMILTPDEIREALS